MVDKPLKHLATYFSYLKALFFFQIESNILRSGKLSPLECY